MRIKRYNRLLPLLIAAVLITASAVIGGTFAQEQKLTLTGTQETLTGTTDFNVSVVNSNGQGNAAPLLTDGAVLTEQIAWCPGRSELLYLECENSETFPVEVTLNMNIKESQLGDVFTCAVVHASYKPGDAQHPDNWAEFLKNAASTGVMSEGAVLPVMDRITVQPGETYSCVLGVHMSENATSDYADKKMDLTFSMTVNANYEPGTVVTPTK